jgi:predicted nuclease of predicted toxin-antitoxin system
VIAILADENVPRASVDLLRTAGMDVESVAERDAGMSDLAVLELARAEGRLLLTFDRDFGELIYRRGHAAPPALVYLRFVPTDPQEAAAVFRRLLEHSEIELDGRFTVVTRDQVRQRSLP